MLANQISVNLPVIERSFTLFVHELDLPVCRGGGGDIGQRKRLPQEKDGIQYYCDNCNSLLYEEFFTLQNVEKDFPPIFDRFFGDEKNRTCKRCGTVMPAPAR